VRQTHPRGDRGGQDEHLGVRGDHRRDRPATGDDPVGTALRVAGVNGYDRAAAQRQGAVAGDDEIQAHPAGRQQEVGRPVGAGGHQQQHARSPRAGGAWARGYLAVGHRFSAEKNGSVPAS